VSGRILVLIVLAVALAGCGSSTSGTETTTTATVPARLMSLTVFDVVDGSLQARTARVPETRAVAAASLEALGVDAAVTISDGTAHVTLAEATPERTAEIVYTLTQFPSIKRVDVAGRTGLTRSDVATFVPPILIETPAAQARVPKTISVSGTASVFEATLVVELRRNGRVLVKRTVTASEGAPAQGTFATTLDAPTGGAMTIAAYSPSAEDGTPQHEQDVPVLVTP
jgi:hypothetical protein